MYIYIHRLYKYIRTCSKYCPPFLSCWESKQKKCEPIIRKPFLRILFLIYLLVLFIVLKIIGNLYIYLLLLLLLLLMLMHLLLLLLINSSTDQCNNSQCNNDFGEATTQCNSEFGEATTLSLTKIVNIVARLFKSESYPLQSERISLAHHAKCWSQLWANTTCR